MDLITNAQYGEKKARKQQFIKPITLTEKSKRVHPQKKGNDKKRTRKVEERRYSTKQNQIEHKIAKN